MPISERFSIEPAVGLADRVELRSPRLATASSTTLRSREHGEARLGAHRRPHGALEHRRAVLPQHGADDLLGRRVGARQVEHFGEAVLRCRRPQRRWAGSSRLAHRLRACSVIVRHLRGRRMCRGGTTTSLTSTRCAAVVGICIRRHAPSGVGRAGFSASAVFARNSATISHCGGLPSWALSRVGPAQHHEVLAHRAARRTPAARPPASGRGTARRRRPACGRRGRPAAASAASSTREADSRGRCELGQALERAVAGDDAVVVAGAEQHPVVDELSSGWASGTRGLGSSSSQRSTSQFISSIASAIGAGRRSTRRRGRRRRARRPVPAAPGSKHIRRNSDASTSISPMRAGAGRRGGGRIP